MSQTEAATYTKYKITQSNYRKRMAIENGNGYRNAGKVKCKTRLSDQNNLGKEIRHLQTKVLDSFFFSQLEIATRKRNKTGELIRI